MVQDRHIVSIKVEKEVICDLSNGDFSDDLGAGAISSSPSSTTLFIAVHLTSKLPQFLHFFVALHIFVVSIHRDFVFSVQVDRSYSQPTDNKLRAWLCHVTRFKFWVPHPYLSNG